VQSKAIFLFSLQLSDDSLPVSKKPTAPWGNIEGKTTTHTSNTYRGNIAKDKVHHLAQLPFFHISQNATLAVCGYSSK